jgi:hypothetical protein
MVYVKARMVVDLQQIAVQVFIWQDVKAKYLEELARDWLAVGGHGKTMLNQRGID